MASMNNRLRQLICFHRRSESDRRGFKTFLRTAQDPYLTRMALGKRRRKYVRVAGASKDAPTAKAARTLAVKRGKAKAGQGAAG
jgi:hypothetical protein